MLAPLRAPVRRPRVLVVDDEPLVCRSLVRLLRHDADVTACSTADDALDAIARGSGFDVILCDLHLPGSDAVDLHAALRASSPSLLRRFIVLTGGATNARGWEFLRGKRVLTKPAARGELLEAISAVLREDEP